MGARISTGQNNKQDYKTPIEFMEAVVHHFGPIAFDLAARSYNTQSPHYFAPVTGPEGPLPLDPLAYGMDAFDHRWHELSKPGTWENYPPERKGLLWLNCEFNDIPPWATRCRNEANMGANILSLTPAAMGSTWFDELIADFADVYLLKGRISFIPGEPYNKDCMLSHFYQTPADRKSTLGPDHEVSWMGRDWRWMYVWDWRKDRILRRWGYPLET